MAVTIIVEVFMFGSFRLAFPSPGNISNIDPCVKAVNRKIFETWRIFRDGPIAIRLKGNEHAPITRNVSMKMGTMRVWKLQGYGTSLSQAARLYAGLARPHTTPRLLCVLLAAWRAASVPLDPRTTRQRTFATRHYGAATSSARSMIPRSGEIWHSKLMGYTVRVVDVNLRRGIAIVTDGKRSLPVYLASIRDPRNGWIRTKMAPQTAR
jgi:hypothetical protein